MIDEDIDEDRTLRDKAPYWVWLAGVALTILSAVTYSIHTGIITPEIGVVAHEVDISSEINLLVRGLVYIFLGFTLLAALVVAPGEYLATLSDIADNYNKK